MQKETLYETLVNIYTDYFDGLYNKAQLNFMLRNLRKENPEISGSEFAELCLDAQWEDATEEDYEKTRKVNEENSDE